MMKRLITLITFLIFSLPCLGQVNPIFVISSFNTAVPAATPTFSPVSGYSGGPTTVTESTTTSPCSSYLYFGTTNPPTVQTNTYSFTTTTTLYGYVHGCPGYGDSSVATWSGTYAAVPSFVRQCNGYANFAATSCGLTGVAAGDTFVIGLEVSSTSASVTAITGATCTAVDTQVNTGLAHTMFSFVCNNVSAGSPTIGVTFAGGNVYKTWLSVAEYTNTQTSALDGHGAGDCIASCTSTMTTSSYTTTANSDVIWSFCAASNGSTVGAGSSPVSFTGRTSPSGTGAVVLLEDGTAGSAGSYFGSCTNANLGVWTELSMGLK